MIAELFSSENAGVALSTGTLIGERYQVVRELGGGGMKLVYLVEDRRLTAGPRWPR